MNDRLKVATQDLADRHTENRNLLEINQELQVWLCLDRVKDGYARKLAHMWHEPFQVVEKCGDHAVRLAVAGTP